MRRMLALVVPLLALGLLQSTARADFFLSGTGGLNGGVGPQTITNGDKVFGNFSCRKLRATGLMFEPSQATCTPPATVV